ncbi:MAG TPA: patatin-like phospholipase family protein, partial [Planctomycetota bacterium]|nr:patatin-like phospholipase family protein [Planctomycetota bacterium]
MTAPGEPPPNALWKVLEDEFVALGGTLPREYEDHRDGVLRDDAAARDAAAPGAGSKKDPLVEDVRRQQRQNDRILPQLYRCIHAQAEDGKPRSALCFSGGGIRSATFNLGVLQSLAKLGLLDKFDYLSTVSGGGYLGSWLSAWIHRHEKGLQGVIDELRGPRDTPLSPEPPPIRHLRSFSRYLSPELGLFSADTWTLVTIYTRNLLLNWLVIIPLLLAVLIIPRICVSVVALNHLHGEAAEVLEQSGIYLLIAGTLLAALSFTYVGLHMPSALRKRTRCRGQDSPSSPPVAAAGGQGKFLLYCLAPLLLSAVCLSTYWAWADSASMNVTYHLACGILLGVLGWGVFALREGDLRRLQELPLVIAAGAVTGLSLWSSVLLLDAFAPSPRSGPEAGAYYAYYVCLAFPLVLMSLSAGGTFYIGLVSRLQATRDDDREWWARFGAWVLIATVVWLLASSLVLFGPALLLIASARVQVLLTSVGGIAGLATVLIAGSSRTPATGAAEKQGTWTAFAMRWVMALAAPLFLGFLIIGLSLGTSWLIAHWLPDVQWTGAGSHFEVLAASPLRLVSAWLLGMVLFGLLMAAVIHTNKFSLHGMYRDRLVRAYLGASRGTQRAPDPFTGFDPMDNLFVHKLRPEFLCEGELLSDFIAKLRAAAGPATGPDKSPPDPVSRFIVEKLSSKARAELEGARDGSLPNDSRLIGELNQLLLEEDFSRVQGGPQSLSDISLAQRLGRAAAPVGRKWIGENRPLRNRLFLEAAYPGGIRPTALSYRPLQVVNIALNLVSGIDPAWQERKAESFTVSALHCGNGRLGYRDSRYYGGPRGISLGTAVTISGAAVSPNMGYHSSPVIAFLLTLFNVRLGWWLGNPGAAGSATYRRNGPHLNVAPLIAEAFRLTNERRKFVYLSDGGHFENLGLYEMLRRRCHYIVVGDAGCDPNCAFDDLGNAARKVRIDMGIPIDFKSGVSIFSRTDREHPRGSCFAVADIDYRAVDGDQAQNGVLVYIKPAFYGN